MSGVSWSEPDDLIAQQQLALFQPLQLQLVGLAGVAQRLDRRVEIAVLLTQPLDVSDEGGAFLAVSPLSFIFASRFPPPRRARLTPRRLNYGYAPRLRKPRSEAAARHIPTMLLRSGSARAPASVRNVEIRRQDFAQRGAILPLA